MARVPVNIPKDFFKFFIFISSTFLS